MWDALFEKYSLVNGIHTPRLKARSAAKGGFRREGVRTEKEEGGGPNDAARQDGHKALEERASPLLPHHGCHCVPHAPVLAPALGIGVGFQLQGAAFGGQGSRLREWVQG